MLVKDLESMEKIVKNNKSLVWNGWDVIHTYPSEKGRTSKFGALVNSQWHIQKRFTPGSNGWDIPDKYVR